MTRQEVALKLASQAYRNARLKRATGVDSHIVVSCIAKAIIATSPRSDHGKLLMRAFMGDIPREERAPAEMAVRYLASHGQVPTPEAVSGRVSAMKEIQEGMSRRVAYANRVAEEDGCKVAEIIARRVQETGESYTWSELNKIMAWPGSPRYRREIMTRLEETGWISTGPEARSLRPGASFLRLSSDYR